MNILVDAHCFGQDATEGVNTFIRGIYSQMTDMMPGATFHFASSDPSRLEEIFSGSNVRIHRLETDRRTARMMWEFPMLARKIKADFSHFQYMAPPVLRGRRIVTLHDILFRDFPDQFPLSYRVTRNSMFRLSASAADILTTVSDYSRRRIESLYGIPSQRIVVTPNAVSQDFFDIDVAAAKSHVRACGVRPYLLNVSRIEPRKNQLALLWAYHELRLAERGYDLVLINQPSLRVADFESYYESLPTSERARIHRLGPVSQDELKYWYRACELFVYPSLAEGFGIPPIEAAAAGVPVICHNDTAMADYDFLGENLADLRDERKLLNLVDKNLTSPPPVDKLKQISDEVRSRYNWRKSAQVLIEEIKRR